MFYIKPYFTWKVGWREGRKEEERKEGGKEDREERREGVGREKGEKYKSIRLSDSCLLSTYLSMIFQLPTPGHFQMLILFKLPCSIPPFTGIDPLSKSLAAQVFLCLSCPVPHFLPHAP